MNRADARCRVAAIANHEGLDTQALLAQAVVGWRAAGLKVAGALAENRSVEVGCIAGRLRDIASGEQVSMRQEQAPDDPATCLLRPEGVTRMAALLLAQIAGADRIVLSKFGKLEARHQGLWPAFEAARAAGRPVLTTVSARQIAEFRAYAPRATWLVSPEDVLRWGECDGAGAQCDRSGASVRGLPVEEQLFSERDQRNAQRREKCD